MATINGMYVLAESEDPVYEVDITDQPVEDGIDTSDHVQRKPRAMGVSGFIVGDDAAEIRERLIALADKGETVVFIGRNLFTGVIQSLNTKHDYKVANGFAFSLSLKEIRVVKSSYVETLPTPIKAAVAPVISSGRKQTKQKKGDKEKEKVEKVKFKAGTPWADE
ncbi:phage baseplate protein [Brevibacillus porteri]|uniref:Dit-like phage tail protein N-terminal domain-containing protein n=1 Tax=Brevibacillus porteri TaxID=2126350 RepID=A0ABX5FKL4_9BACL|nr:hypothetical protein [Brevibacillus porteri]MED1801778.1 hypothetical protein [Brevibacillus porteri]MED2134909.1 hypothetical protein [Brevibacillus porteri]MED2748416.1 hypothetical protein [Brevibacillus porteri]MED2818340.1 hypothetical protein [Brevibacillus porteri]MED2897701.1 hypothetical protein [Brevibacillus porteri]